MREYTLFNINKNYYDIYQNDPSHLFKVLNDLNHLNENSFNYGITLYDQLCKPFDINILKKYISERYHLGYHNIYNINDSLILLKKTRVIIKSKYNLPIILKIFKNYSKTIFVCDFNNKDYFFLEQFIKDKNLSYN